MSETKWKTKKNSFWTIIITFKSCVECWALSFPAHHKFYLYSYVEHSKLRVYIAIFKRYYYKYLSDSFKDSRFLMMCMRLSIKNIGLNVVYTQKYTNTHTHVNYVQMRIENIQIFKLLLSFLVVQAFYFCRICINFFNGFLKAIWWNMIFFYWVNIFRLYFVTYLPKLRAIINRAFTELLLGKIMIFHQ